MGKEENSRAEILMLSIELYKRVYALTLRNPNVVIISFLKKVSIGKTWHV